MLSSWSQGKSIAALCYAAEAHQRQAVPSSELSCVVHVTMVAIEAIAALAQKDDLVDDLAVSNAPCRTM